MSTPSVYVARVRRAFLLRAHPDRFRSYAPKIRKQQAALIQAISDRMERQDFLSYIYGETGDSSPIQPVYSTLPYVLEEKDGSLKTYCLNLNASVDEVLLSMVNALRQNGLNTLTLPPKATCTRRLHEQAKNSKGMHWVSSNKATTGIDHQYDIHWNRGRDLWHFLSSLDTSDISTRKASRFDVTATASVIRRDYQFSAVDGTGLGWSSASLATLLRALADLYQEHSHKFQVPSFYPLRLVWSSEDQPMDLYGANLSLNPASTPIQWLDQLLSVTPEALQVQTELRARLIDASARVNNFLDVTFQKGHSCSSREYFDALDRLACLVPTESSIGAFNQAITLERIHVMVESSQACRRAVLTKEGHIRIGSSMKSEDVVSAISTLQSKAREKQSQSRLERDLAKDTAKRIKLELGLLRVRQSKTVSDLQFVDALVRLVELKEREELRRLFAGNNLDIVGSGQFCHLGDDGSLMVPWDWSM